VPEVGPKVAASIAEFFSEPANLKLIKKLHKAGVHPTAEKRVVKSQKLGGRGKNLIVCDVFNAAGRAHSA